MDIDAFVAEARKLYSVYEHARVDFYLHLMNGEARLDWRAGGFETFERFLDAKNIKTVASYRGFCAAIDKFGTEEVRRIGVDAALALLRVPDGQINEARAHFDLWVTENEKPIPARTAEILVMTRYGASPRMAPRLFSQMSELSKLRAENSALKKELVSCKKKIRELERARETVGSADSKAVAQ